MVDSKTTNSVNRAHGKSLVQKTFFCFGHFSIILFCTWLTLFDGLDSIGDIFGKSLMFADFNRVIILLVCAILYFARQTLTLFYLLHRKVAWSEVFGLLFFFALFEIGLLLLVVVLLEITAFHWDT